MNFRFFVYIFALIVTCKGFSITGGMQYQNHLVKSTLNKFQSSTNRYKRVTRVQSIKMPKQMKLLFFQLLHPEAE